MIRFVCDNYLPVPLVAGTDDGNTVVIFNQDRWNELPSDIAVPMLNAVLDAVSEPPSRARRLRAI